MNQTKQEVVTISTKLQKRKESATSGAGFTIHVSELDELQDIKKVQEQLNVLLQFNSYRLYYSLQEFQTESSRVELKPAVYVKDQQLYYDSNLMEVGKLYEIDWEGQKWALKKTERDIEFMKWEPDTHV